MNKALAEKLKTLPSSPGVYFHKNEAGEIIYVGKAAVLKNRVRQYFQKTQKDPKTEALVREIFDTDWIVVETEMDALFLESEMIKRYMPKWNILLRDDKTVSYVRVDMKSPVPYVSMTRTPMDDGARYVGPFYAKLPVEKALRVLRRVFPYYIKPFDGKKTLDTDLELTPGIEVGRATAAEYKKNLRKLIRYLEGGREKLLRDLEKQMREASDAGRYEEAAELRNQLYGLRELKRKIVFSDKEFMDISSDQALLQLQKLLGLAEPPKRIEGYDVSHQSGENAVASMVVFTNGAADRAEYRKFKIRQKNRMDDLASMREVLERRLRHKEWAYPDLVILDGSVGQLNAVRDLLLEAGVPVIGRDKSGDHGRNAEVKIVVPVGAGGDSGSDLNDDGGGAGAGDGIVGTGAASGGYKMVPLKANSHIAKLIARIDEEAHRFAITYHTLLKRKNMFR